MNELCLQYIELKRNLIKPTTLRNYENHFRCYVENIIGDRKVKDLTHSFILNYYKKLATEKINTKDRLSYETIRGLNAFLCASFNTAKRDKVIQENPCTGCLSELKKLTTQKCADEQVINRLSSEQAKAFLDFVKNTSWYKQYNKLFVLLNTGIRVSELCGLLWDDIDFDNNKIYIRHNLVYTRDSDGKHKLIMQSPKTASSIRTIPMFSEVKEILLQIKQQQRVCVSYENYKGFVFVSRNNTPSRASIIATNLRLAVAAYNEQQTNESLIIHKCSPHTLRHTFCSILFEKNFNHKTIQRIMGHSRINITLDVYTQLFPEKDVEEFENFESLIS